MKRKYTYISVLLIHLLSYNLNATEAETLNTPGSNLKNKKNKQQPAYPLPPLPEQKQSSQQVSSLVTQYPFISEQNIEDEEPTVMTRVVHYLITPSNPIKEIDQYFDAEDNLIDKKYANMDHFQRHFTRALLHAKKTNDTLALDIFAQRIKNNTILNTNKPALLRSVKDLALNRSRELTSTGQNDLTQNYQTYLKEHEKEKGSHNEKIKTLEEALEKCKKEKETNLTDHTASFKENIQRKTNENHQKYSLWQTIRQACQAGLKEDVIESPTDYTKTIKETLPPDLQNFLVNEQTHNAV